MKPEHELIESIRSLKQALGDEGDYSICLANGTPMGWGEVMFIGSLLEKVDLAVEKVTDSLARPKEEQEDEE